MLQQVAANPGTIGYAPLLQARQNSAFVPPGGGAGTPTFWAEVQDGANKYADPSTNGDDNTLANANCEQTHYTDGGTTTVQPPSTEDVWSQVTTAKAQKNYELCNPTYDLALINYQGFPGVVNALPEEEAIKNYCEYMLSMGPAGGQPEILDHDDLGDSISTTPSRNVLKIAQEGCAKL